MWTFVLGLLLALVGAARALAARYKTELATAAVVGLAVLLASPFDRWLIIASVIISFLAGHKYGAARASPAKSL